MSVGRYELYVDKSLGRQRTTERRCLGGRGRALESGLGKEWGERAVAMECMTAQGRVLVFSDVPYRAFSLMHPKATLGID